MDLDRKLIFRLRELAASGHGVCEMLRWLLEQLSIAKSSSPIQAIAYFRQAFCVSVGDASAIGAWSAFPGGTWSDEDLDQFLMPRILAAKDQWADASIP